MSRTIPPRKRIDHPSSGPMRAVMRSVGIDPRWTLGRIYDAVTRTESGALRDLLTISNHKTELGQSRGWRTAVLHLAPHLEAGFLLCPYASEGCAGACLNTAGRMPFGTDARIRRSLYWRLWRDDFEARLIAEIERFRDRAEADGMRAAVRPNGTSDVFWERTRVLRHAPARVQFYDYTKAPARVRARTSIYHLTFSLSERPDSAVLARQWFRRGGNVAVVIGSKCGTIGGSYAAVERILGRGQWRGRPVVDGDRDDLRFLDPPGHWVILRAKGAAVADRSGFVRRVSV